MVTFLWCGRYSFFTKQTTDPNTLSIPSEKITQWEDSHTFILIILLWKSTCFFFMYTSLTWTSEWSRWKIFWRHINISCFLAYISHYSASLYPVITLTGRTIVCSVNYPLSSPYFFDHHHYVFFLHYIYIYITKTTISTRIINQTTIGLAYIWNESFKESCMVASTISKSIVKLAWQDTILGRWKWINLR